MAELVNSNQLAALIDPQNGQVSDASVVLGNDNAIRVKHNTHDADGTVHLQSSVIASRPAAGTLGRKWLASDTKKLYFDTGSAWVEVAYAPIDAASLTGGLTVAGGLTVSSGTTTLGALACTTIAASGLVSANAGLVVVGTTVLNGRTYTWPGSESAGYHLQTNGSGTLSWVAIPAVGTFVNKTSGATITLATTDRFIRVDTAAIGGGCTITLMAASAVPPGTMITVYSEVVGGVYNTTVQRAGSDTLWVANSSVTSTIMPNADKYQYYFFYSDGVSRWYISEASGV